MDLRHVGDDRHLYPHRSVRRGQRLPDDLGAGARRPGRSPARSATPRRCRPPATATRITTRSPTPARSASLRSTSTSTRSSPARRRSPRSDIGPGETVTYRITVTNNGIADANNVQLTDTPDAPIAIQSITPSQGTCTGTDLRPGDDHHRPGAGHDRRDRDASWVRHLSLGQAAEQHRDGYVAGRRRDQPGRQHRVGVDHDAPVGRDVDHEDVLTRPAGRRRPGHLHADDPQRWTRDGRRGRCSTCCRRRCRTPTPCRSPAGPASASSTPPGRLGAPPGPGFPMIACDIPQFGPGEDRVITVKGTLAPDSAGTLVDNFAAALSAVPADLTSAPSPTSPITRRGQLHAGHRRRRDHQERDRPHHGHRSATPPSSSWWPRTPGRSPPRT